MHSLILGNVLEICRNNYWKISGVEINLSEENFMKFYFRCRVSDRCHVEPGIYRKYPSSSATFHDQNALRQMYGVNRNDIILPKLKVFPLFWVNFENNLWVFTHNYSYFSQPVFELLGKWELFISFIDKRDFIFFL